MDKTTFKQEISNYKSRGGQFAFTFGDIRLPVIYHEALNTLGVKMPSHEVFVPVDYSIDLGDNLDVLKKKILDKYPQLSGQTDNCKKSEFNERNTINISVAIPMLSEEDLLHNELIGYIEYLTAGIFQNMKNKELSAEESYFIDLFRIINRILECFQRINQARNFILRRPTLKYLDKNEEMTIIDYYKYHYDVVIHKLNTLRDLSFKLINIVFNLNLKDKDCNWTHIRKKSKNITIPGVLDTQVLYYNLMINIESERNESSHNGFIKNRIFDGLNSIAMLSQWLRLNKIPKNFIENDPMGKGGYYSRLLAKRKKELLKKIDEYKAISIYCIHVLTCCLSVQCRSKTSKALSEKYSEYIQKADHSINNYDRKINKIKYLFPYLKTNDDAVKLLKDNKDKKYKINVSIIKVK